jgi:hypothetical protein
MNMKNITKAFIVCLVLTVAFAMVGSTAMAQFGYLQLPSFTQQPLAVPTVSPTTGDIMIDNFEYWDSPYNHGWIQVEPPYPVYGFGIGYATIFNTVLDLQEGSRVLDVYRPSSVFLLSTPYARHAIRYPCQGCLGMNIGSTGTNPLNTPILSFKFRAPIGVEPWDIFEFRVYFNDCPTQRYIRIIPVQDTTCAGCGGGYNITGPDANGNYTITIGREFMDGTWHTVWLDLVAMTGITNLTVQAIEASGQMFRLDDIVFRASDNFLCEPYLFKIGPRYAQFYEPYAFLFFADFRDYCGPSVMDALLMDANLRMPNDPNYSEPMALASDFFLTDPNDIEAYWLGEGADPNYGFFGSSDPNDPDYTPTFGQADPNISAAMGHSFMVIPQLPVFNPAYGLAYTQAGGIINPLYAPGIIGNQTFQWNATVGGVGASGVEFEGLTPLPIDPTDGMPTYIPVYDNLSDPMGNYISKTHMVSTLYGGPFFGPNIVPALEAALYNSGFTFWPNIAVLNFTPYVFEDIILSIEVSNGRTSDMETFPIEVVNYPVENYPPYIEDPDDRLFPVGVQSFYALSVVDPDNMIFSMAHLNGQVAATTHTPLIPGLYDTIRDDMSNITWSMTLNGLPSYQYGPWMQSLIDPCAGIVSFFPKFEGAYDAVVVATDNRGASGVANFTIFSVNPGTWLNHPPIVLGDWDHPQIVRAGEELILTEPEFNVVDPDGDELYFSSNIGSCGYTSTGRFLWTFTTNFPGFYTAEIIAYDIRGGYAIVTLDIEVKPWWSF